MKQRLVLFLILLSVVALSADGVQPAGTGTGTDPYQVTALDHLLWISTNSTSWDKYFIQNVDIDASATSGWNEGAGFSPIGNSSTYFTGNYDGQDHTITGLFIDRPATDHLGLFGFTDEAEIDNIGVTNVDITGDDHVGGLAGVNYNFSSIDNCYATGSVNGDQHVGGLVGYNHNNSNVSNSHAAISVNGNWYVGGLVGMNVSTISNGYSSGSVFGTYHTGGLVGVNSAGSVNNCYATGSVTGTNTLGGLVGNNQFSAFINNSYAIGSVTGGSYAGGLAGANQNSSFISNCYSTGAVSGTNNIEGLLGYSYSSTVSNSFWDTETSGQSTSEGGTGKTTAEMIEVRTYTDVAWSDGLSSPWDFVGNPYDDTGNSDYWIIDSGINDGYPFLCWQTGGSPNAPTNVIITIVGDDVQLDWDDMSAVSYNIYRSNIPYAEDWGEAYDTSAVNSYLNIGAAQGTKYIYYITFLDE